MKQFAVIGHPIGHSLSPLMHNTGFAQLGIDAHYATIDVAPEHLASMLRKFREEQFAGFNITVPHKQTVMQFIDRISDEAQAIGAVNTVHQQNGIWYGYNTDVIGILKSLEPFQKKIQNASCLIFGAGGAARSLIFVLTQYVKPKKIYITSRTEKKSQSLAQAFHIPNIEIEVLSSDSKKIIEAIDDSILIVNTTPLGMFPNVNASPLPDHASLNHHHIVFDLIYRPLQTSLLRQAQAAETTTIGGLEMLIQQGAASFKIWTGQDMPISIVRSALLKELSE